MDHRHAILVSIALGVGIGLLSIEASSGIRPKTDTLTVKMTVKEIKRDRGAHVVMLQDVKGDRLLPIWIGDREAQAIQMRLRYTRAQRPLTHELLERVLRTLRAKVDRVEVADLKNNVFIGTLTLKDNRGRRHRIDGRPSDLITLAVGAGLPVHVARHVLDKAGVTVYPPQAPARQAPTLERPVPPVQKKPDGSQKI